MERLLPLVARARVKLRRHLRRPHDLHWAADRSWVLSPGVTQAAPRPIQFDGDLDRITGVPEQETIEGQKHKAQGGMIDHGPTVAHEFSNVLLTRGHFFTPRLALAVQPVRPPVIGERALACIGRAALMSSAYGARYFGHWLADDLPRLLAAEPLAPPISTLSALTANQRAYLQALDLKPRLLEQPTRIRRLIVIDDRGQNEGKRRRFHELRQRALVKFPVKRCRGVMLLRGQTGVQRHMINELELAAHLERRGFVIMDPAVEPVSEIIAYCQGAEVIAGVEGSQLVNGVMWMPTTSSLCVLQPPARFNLALKDYSDCIGVRHYGFIVGQAEGPHTFSVQPAKVDQLLRKMGH